MRFQRVSGDWSPKGGARRPVYVHVSGHPGTQVRSVRGLRFRNVVARGLMHPVVSAPRPGLVSDISFVDCRFMREPASPERYPNSGNVGFAECQRFPDDVPDATYALWTFYTANAPKR